MSLLLYFSLCACRFNRAVEVDHTKILSGMQLDDGIVHTFVSIGRMSGIRATVIVAGFQARFRGSAEREINIVYP
jgi:hypothetical protein